jgi:beta-N-acetylhexosaminidase
VSDIDSLRRKAAGLLVMRLGSNMRPPRRAEEDAVEVRRLLENHPLGGVILFNGTWPETRQTLIDLQRSTDRPLLVMTDMERGVGQQVAGATIFPHAMAYAELSEEDVEAFARAAAREALACGVHVAFAPVADVNRNPDNPIISTRAFGTDTATVSRLVAAYVRGSRAEGLLTTPKHFPGHGNTAEDSHAVLPTVTDDRREIEHEDLPPFRAAFDEGAELVMTAHISYPSLDPSGRPATMSHPILTGLLRERMGFEGVVITDSLHMAGIQEEGRTEAELAVEQIAAGVDLLLDPQDPVALIEGIAQAVAEGRLAEERVDDALARADRLRAHFTARFGDGFWTDPSSAVSTDEVGVEEHRRLASEAARRAIKVEGTIPFHSGEGVVAVLFKSVVTHLDAQEQALGEALREALPDVSYYEISSETPPSERETIAEVARRANAVLLALIVKPAAWHAFGLPEDLAGLARQVMASTPAAVAALGSPRGLEGFEDAAARIVTFSDAPVSQRALVELLRESVSAGEAEA